jgi:hypothetical protein
MPVGIAKRLIAMKDPKPVNGPALSAEVYELALERIEALVGCTEDSPEEMELVDWVLIADAYEQVAAVAGADLTSPGGTDTTTGEP